MAIAPTGAIFKSFTFDGIDSRDFGVYISGDYVYNSPERDIETVEIPGRNGAYIMDKGRFHNITVTYPAGMFASNSDDFAEGIRQFRNALASRKGYCRLTDQYHPLEYRMAVYRGGLEVEPAATGGGNEAAQFDIVFECKPQRYLVQGDEPRQVASGAHLNNPTLFESHPLLKADGYGSIGINGETVRIINGVVGDVILANATKLSYGYNRPHVAGENDVKYTIPSYIDGDVTVHGVRLTFTFNKGAEFTKLVSAGIHIDHVDDNYNNPPTATASGSCTSTKGTLTINVGNITMNGTTRNIVAMAVGSIDATRPNGITTSFNITVGLSISVKPTGIELGFVGGNNIPSTASSELKTYNVGEVTGYSSELAADGTVYIDLDVCEAYRPVSSGIVDLNANVDIPAEPPALKPGANTITFDNTITELDIVPRWWEV